MATTHAARDTGKRRQHGLTLLELAIVVAITAIVAATAAPSFTALIDARRLDSAATRLAADIQLARSEAITRNQPLRLSLFTGTGVSCWIVHSGAAADCRCGDGAGAMCSAGARTVKGVVLANNERVSVAGNVASIVFDPSTARARRPARCASSARAAARCITSSMSSVGCARARPTARCPATRLANSPKGIR